MPGLDLPVEKWSIVNRLLDEALDLPAAEREAWLDGLTADYAPVRPVLRRLLARTQHVLSGGFLEESAAPAAWLSRPEPGDVVGPWRLIHELGEGGMAWVWLAERCDGLLGRPVALKLPRAGWRQEALSERISREREILAGLDHPNIARLLDAGITTDGQPYLALEYVEGRHVDIYCREEKLPLASRLRLFEQIAGAAAHAHTKLVVHRDLKPSNILVTADGQVRLLDFGIAKLLDAGETRETELTQWSGRALTVEYASPEQIAGRPLTVASDVYSLGVVLYELVTGTRPYRLKRDSRAELEEAIAEAEPQAPSDAVEDKVMARPLHGDLDTIILKALKKNPAARYATADAFLEDIRRYTENRPVLAQPDSAWYRLSKFVHRNRLAVMAGLAIAVMLIAGTATVAWQAHVAFAEKRRAEETKAFVLSVLLNAHSYWAGKALSAQEVLKQAQARIDQLPDAETRTELLNIIGASLLSLQDTDGAESAIGRALHEGKALGRGHPQTLRAMMLQTWILLFRGHTDAARRTAEETLQSMRDSGRAIPEDLAAAHRVRSEVALFEGDGVKAEEAALNASQFAEARLGPRHNQSVLALVNLGLAYRLEGRPEQALETERRAYRRALEAYSGRESHPNTVKARVALGQALAATGDVSGGIDEITRAVHDEDASLGPDCHLAGLHLQALARLQLDAGKAADAARTMDRALPILLRHMDAGSRGYAAILQLQHEISERAPGRAGTQCPRLSYGRESGRSQ